MASLRKVVRKDYPYLYELLKDKKQEQNISHKRMPTWKEHVKFNENKPYKADYIVLYYGKPAGRIYIATYEGLPEIGIHIHSDFQGKGLGSWALKEVLKTHKGSMLANVAPANKRSQEFFIKHGFKLIQFTYKLDG